jgi:hypothetical protein
VDFQDKKKSVFYGFILSTTEKERKRENTTIVLCVLASKSTMERGIMMAHKYFNKTLNKFVK